MKIAAATFSAPMLPLFLLSITPGIDGASSVGSSAGVGREALLRLARTVEGKHNALLQKIDSGNVRPVVKATNSVEDGSTKNTRKLSEDECLAAVSRLDVLEAACPKKCDKGLGDLFGFGDLFGAAEGELPPCDDGEAERDPTTCGADSGTSCADSLREINDSVYDKILAGLRSCGAESEVAVDYVTYGEDDTSMLMALYLQDAAEKCGYGPDVISFTYGPPFGQGSCDMGIEFINRIDVDCPRACISEEGISEEDVAGGFQVCGPGEEERTPESCGINSAATSNDSCAMYFADVANKKGIDEAIAGLQRCAVESDDFGEIVTGSIFGSPGWLKLALGIHATACGQPFMPLNLSDDGSDGNNASFVALSSCASITIFAIALLFGWN